MRILAIPTNRPVDRAVKSALYESSLVGCDIPVVVVDNGVPEASRHNLEWIQTLSVRDRIYYFDSNSIARLICDLEKELQLNDLSTLLFPFGVDYGRISNMLFIFSHLLNATYMHRRDSDCYFDGGTPPLATEIQLLGQQYSDIRNRLDECYEPRRIDEKVVIVGGGYLENNNIDFTDPEEERKYRLYKGIGKSDQEKARLQTSRPMLKNSIKIPYYPDCGNVAYHDIFKRMPNFIGRHAVGFDYHLYLVTLCLEFPIIYHFNTVKHDIKQDPVRAQDIFRRNYHTGLLKELDYNRLFGRFVHCFKKEWDQADAKARENWADNVTKQLCESVRSYQDEFEGRVQRLDKASLDMFPELWQKSSSSHEFSRQLVAELDAEYQQSLALIKVWPHILANSAKFDPLKYCRLRAT